MPQLPVQTPSSSPSYPMMPRAGSPPAYPVAKQGYPATSPVRRRRSSAKWLWWVIGLLALGAAAGAVLALVTRS